MYEAESRFAKKQLIWFALFVFVCGGVAWFATRTVEVADTAIVHYEEFQEIYNTCAKINIDLATVRAVPEEDRMFASFSKAAMIAAKKQQMTRWVEEYNAKSKMWNRALWKSDKLPYQLRTEDFTNYQGNFK